MCVGGGGGGEGGFFHRQEALVHVILLKVRTGVTVGTVV